MSLVPEIALVFFIASSATLFIAMSWRGIIYIWKKMYEDV